MKRIAAVLFFLLAMGAVAQAQEIAIESEFGTVYQRLLDAGWLKEDCGIETVAQDYEKIPLKHRARSAEQYAELIVTDEGQAYQYGFGGFAETVEGLALCIGACTSADAQAVADELFAAYSASAAYQKEHRSEDEFFPRGIIFRNDIRYDLSPGWLFLTDMNIERVFLKEK